MKLVQGTDKLPDKTIVNPVVTWGVFDGVHVGHQNVLKQVISESQQYKFSSVVITFDRHPAEVLYNKKVPLLIGLRERLELIESNGIDFCVLIRFTKAFSNTTAKQFIDEIIINRLKASCVVLGYDSKFGHDREGDINLLEGYKNLAVKKAKVTLHNGRPYSSTLIREFINKGQIEDVNMLLGRKYSLKGQVITGASRGKSIGFPTANLRIDNGLIPASGVYAVDCDLPVLAEGTILKKGVVNIGVRPTFSENRETVEVYIIDYMGPDFYGKELKLNFLFRLRDERKFKNVEELKLQIDQDVKYALSRQ